MKKKMVANQPKVSVILPVYNVAPYLPEAMDSLLDQTLREIEIICVDDCSTDNSWEILQDYAAKDNRVLVLRQEVNQGPGAARNRGLDVAKGEYIMFLDADDWFEADACEVCYNQITRNHNDIIIFWYNQYIEDTDEVKPCRQMVAPFENWLSSSNIRLSEVGTNFIVSCYTVCMMYRKAMLDAHNIRYPNYRNSEDHYFFYFALAHADSVSIIDRPLYNYRIRTSSATFVLSNQQNDIPDVKKYIIKRMKEENIGGNIAAAMYVHIIQSCLYWFNRYVAVYPQIEEEFYNNIRELFSSFDFEYIREQIKPRITEERYAQYRQVIKYSHKIYKENVAMMQKSKQNKKPKVSVILPVYNVAPFLPDALDSLLQQTLRGIEIICVDDCSSDNSWEILQDYAAKDNRVLVLRQEVNQGPGAARNRGLDIARGEYIMFLDPDDWYELNACELCYNQITKNQNDLVIFGHSRHEEATDEIIPDQTMLKPFKKFLSLPDIRLKDVDTNFIVSCYTVMMIYRHSFLDKYNIRYSCYRNYEDHLFFITALIHADTLSVIDKPLYNYRIRETSITHEINNKQDDILPVKSEILREADKIEGESKVKDAVYAHTIYNSLFWFNKYVEEYDTTAEESFYDNIRKLFTSLDQTYIRTNIKPRLKKAQFIQYKKIVKYTYKQYKRKQRWQNLRDFLFSVQTDEKSHNVITFMGIKIKIHRDALVNYHLLYKMIAWLFPTPADRNNIKKICDNIESRKAPRSVQKNYPKLLKTMKNKKGKIRVLFLVCENSKWKAQTLFDLMEQSDDFEPIIALSVLKDVAAGIDTIRNELEANAAFFAARNMKTVYAYQDDKFVDLREFEPDIVFYEQPWQIPGVHHPKNVSKFALTYYIPYSVNNYTLLPLDYNQSFHKYIFRMYALNKKWEGLYRRLSHRTNIFGAGHPALDNFYLNKNYKTKHNYVIYAPHFAFFYEGTKSPVNYGTFETNGHAILEFAQKHPEFNWVFKPHPRLRYELILSGKSKDEVEEYFRAWAKIGKVCEDSSYVDLFLDSRALITDCGSFLTEYFCTGKPLIHLISEHLKVQPNELSKPLYNTFYKVHNLEEMYDTFERVLMKSDDYMKDKRLQALNKSGLADNYAARNILEDIRNTCRKAG